MTSALGVEQSRERRFLFQCPCGTSVVTSNKSVTCANCGKTMEVHRVRKRRQPRDPELSSWNLAFSTATTQRTWHRHKEPDYHQLFRNMATAHPSWRRLGSPDYNDRCVHLGLLILLSPLWAPLLWILLGPLFAPLITALTPEQDRAHHYERRNVQLHDGRGRSLTIPTWKRVDD